MVGDDVLEAIRSPNAKLFLKIGPYFYEDGTSKELLYLWGMIRIQYKASRYNIPVEIWLQEDHPFLPPLVYVKPTAEMYISPVSKVVQPDGLVVLPYLTSWTSVRSSSVKM